ncbi:hypothetical protein [Moorena sp. SIO4G3]|uniref:hypothetical protein n=1 Tax=Moorena sp. SIO4G3 TaxID=2607821 RepID=UPI00142A5C43|nr:hypothetical protein [Moorena sp. SIO4G3]NEO76939.1 hypothetical protein [Moorena sp. SIO4G3]
MSLYSRLPTPDSRFPIPDSRFPIPDSPQNLLQKFLKYVIIKYFLCYNKIAPDVKRSTGRASLKIFQAEGWL